MKAAEGVSFFLSELPVAAMRVLELTDISAGKGARSMLRGNPPSLLPQRLTVLSDRGVHSSKRSCSLGVSTLVLLAAKHPFT